MTCPDAGGLSTDNLVGRDFPGSSDAKGSTCSAGDPSLIPWIGKFHWRRYRLSTPVFLYFPGGSDSKESTCNMGELGSIPRLGISPEGGHGNPPQYFCLGNPHGQRSLAGYISWDPKKLDMTEQLPLNPCSSWVFCSFFFFFFLIV